MIEELIGGELIVVAHEKVVFDGLAARAGKQCWAERVDVLADIRGRIQGLSVRIGSIEFEPAGGVPRT